MPNKEDVKVYLGNLFWWQYFQDDVLKDLIATSIVQNYDMKMASERILEYQARVGLARASQFPTVGASGYVQTVKVSEVGPTPIVPGAVNNTYGTSISLMANYEADFWGKFSKATQAARASLLATEEGRNVTLMTLVSAVASSYISLRELDLEMEIAKQTLESRKESLDLVTARQEGGVATMMDVDQAKSLYLDAQKTITQIEQQIMLQENTISNLMGEAPHSIPRGKALTEQISTEPIPVGLPSSLLLNRPDIRQAEANLIAANANIGVARAYYYPQITLTGSSGTLSKQLANLFSAPSYNWGLAANVLQPIFNGGQIRSNVLITESQQRQAVISYQQTIQNSFKDVSNALIGFQEGSLYEKQQQEYTDTLADQSFLAKLRYEGGVSSYLEVLDTERQYFQAELELAKAKGNVFQNLIALYKSLGGGWQQSPDMPKPPQASPVSSGEVKEMSPAPAASVRQNSPSPAMDATKASPAPSEEATGISPAPTADATKASPTPTVEATRVSPGAGKEAVKATPTPGKATTKAPGKEAVKATPTPGKVTTKTPGKEAVKATPTPGKVTTKTPGKEAVKATPTPGKVTTKATAAPGAKASPSPGKKAAQPSPTPGR
jgi:multidrug efflux system outer membrane protein